MKTIQVSKPFIGEEELEAVRSVFATGWLGMGAHTKEFEEALSVFIGSNPSPLVIAVNTGTTALHLALDGIGLCRGAEVIMPSLTFVATAQAVTAAGGVPVFCDINERDLNIDVDCLRGLITDKTSAVVPVHYRGVPCDIDGVLSVAQSRGVRVVEDAAHAFGSSTGGRRIGSFGDLTCFSFDPIKNITCGEGGAVVTRDEALAERLRNKRILGIDKDTWSRYRNERSWFYDVVGQGYRYHMSNINAAMGIVQLKKYASMNSRKIQIARTYDDAFRGTENIHVLETNYDGIGLFSYMVLVKEGRDDLMSFLKGKGIVTGIHYIPVHHFSFFKKYKRKDLPVTDKVYDQLLTLPLYCDMTDEDVDRVSAAVIEWERGR